MLNNQSLQNAAASPYAATVGVRPGLLGDSNIWGNSVAGLNAPGVGMRAGQPMHSPTGGLNVPLNSSLGISPMSRAHGGATRNKKKMIAAHFNPRELKGMDVLQGSVERSARTGEKSYRHLESVLKNPHILSLVHQHTRAAHAHGGPAHMQHAEADDGRYGDTELAYIGPITRALLDSYAGHKTRNPHDGHPEYFSLGGLLGGIGNVLGGSGGLGGMLGGLMGGGGGGGGGLGGMLGGLMGGGGGGSGGGLGGILSGLGSVAQKALPMIGQLAGGALGTEFGSPQLGSMLGGMAGNLGSQVLGGLAPSTQQQPQGMYSNLSNGLNSAMNAYGQGGGLQQMMGQGMAGFGQGMNNPMGQFMQNAGNNYSQYGNMQQAAGSGMQGMGGAMGGPMGGFLQGAGGAFGSGANPQQILASGGYGAGYGMNNPMGAFLRNASSSYGSGGGLGEAMQAGGMGAMNAYQQQQPMYGQQQMYGPQQEEEPMYGQQQQMYGPAYY